MKALLEVQGLSVELPTAAGWVRPVNEVSLRIAAGESLGLVGGQGGGPSGDPGRGCGARSKPRSCKSGGIARAGEESGHADGATVARRARAGDRHGVSGADDGT